MYIYVEHFLKYNLFFLSKNVFILATQMHHVLDYAGYVLIGSGFILLNHERVGMEGRERGMNAFSFYLMYRKMWLKIILKGCDKILKF